MASAFNLSCLPEYPALPRSFNRSLHALVRLEFAAPASVAERPPIHLALVIDRSSSMAGQKLALTKKAAIDFANWLTRRDFLTVVAYDDQVETVLSPTPLTDKCAIVGPIEAIVARGNTNLSGGWLRALSELASNADPKHKRRVVLLTDGQANRGVTGPAQLNEIAAKFRDLGVSTSTVGFGQDFNQEVLKAIAHQGGGCFHYAAQDESVAQAFQAEFGDLISVVAQNMELIFAPANGVKIKEVLSDLPHKTSAAGITIQLGDGHAEESKPVAFNLTLPALSGCAPGSLVLGRITGRCDTVQGDFRPLQRSLDMEIQVNESGNLPDVNPEVLQEVWLCKSAALKIHVAQMIAKNEYKPAAALLYKHALDGTALPLVAKTAGVTAEIVVLRQLASQFDRLGNEVRQAVHEALSKQLYSQSAAKSAGMVGFRNLAASWKHSMSLSPQRPEELKDLQQVLRQALEQQKFPEEQMRAFALIADELVRNAFDHGCKGQPNAAVAIDLQITADYARITVHDAGPGFNVDATLREAQEIVQKPNQRGRGLLLVQKLAQRAHWDTRQGTTAEAVVNRTPFTAEPQFAPHSAPASPSIPHPNGLIQRRDQGDFGTVILKLKGDLDPGSLQYLEKTFEDLLKSGHNKIILDAQELSHYIGSAAIGALVQAGQKAVDHDGKIVIVGATPAVRAVFDMLGLNAIMNFCNDYPTAYSLF